MLTSTQIFQAVIDTLMAGMATRSITGVSAVQWYQPRVVGAPTGMAMLLSNVHNHRYGFLGRCSRWDFTASQMSHTEVQAREVTLQCTGWSPATVAPLPLNPYTSSDLAEIAATILASDAGRCQLRQAGLGIERISQVRDPYFKDETNQFTGNSSFDFTMAFNQVERTTTPIVDETVVKIAAV